MNHRTASDAAPQAESRAQAESRVAWHALPVDEVLRRVDSSPEGLSDAEAAQRLQQNGPNRLPQQAPPPWWKIALRQFQSPLIYILLAAAVVALATGDVRDALFIGLVLVINALIGGYQEWRAEKSSRALQKLLQIRALVQREGEKHELDAEEVVPGDLILLESGNRVSADLRLLSTHDLEVDESLLTGESTAVTKDGRWSGDKGASVGDRLNLAYAGSIVVRGRGQGVVVATATETMVGQLALDVMETAGGKTPLLERMEKFARTVAYAVLAAVVVVSLLGYFVQGHSVSQIFMFGVALAVSAIPEGLPAALTVALSIATVRMAAKGVIVRRLAAVEGLGSCTMIASDKTGTLTCNELTVREVHLADGTTWPVTGQGFEPEGQLRIDDQPATMQSDRRLGPLVDVAVLCNEAELTRKGDAWNWRGDPTEIALLTLADKLGADRAAIRSAHPQVAEIPFESENQYAATFHRAAENATEVYVKGAPERVLEMCQLEGETAAERLKEAAEAMASRGYRVLGLARGEAAEIPLGKNPPRPEGLTFLALVGMIDPLRSGVREAVQKCGEAGIRVCMVTGDHPVTAMAIARDLGLANDPQEVIAGPDLEGKSLEQLREVIRRAKVFARVSPRQKLELVEAARAEGHFVAVTGDGVNDAPALRAANIGVAMGKDGTDVAREAAELVISDDNFSTIVSGVEQGRVAYDNVRKVIYLLISTGAGEVLLIAAAFTAGAMLPLPLLPVQLLWLNLVTNGIQGIALAFEPAEKDVLRRRPRDPHEPIFNRLMIERTVVAAAVMATVGMAAFWWMIRSGWSESSARNALLLLMVLFENVHIGNCRSETRSALSISPLRSPFLLIGAASAFAIHVLALYLPPLQAVLQTEPIDGATWGVLVALSLTIFVAIEIHKWTWRLRGYTR